MGLCRLPAAARGLTGRHHCGCERWPLSCAYGRAARDGEDDPSSNCRQGCCGAGDSRFDDDVERPAAPEVASNCVHNLPPGGSQATLLHLELNQKSSAYASRTTVINSPGLIVAPTADGMRLRFKPVGIQALVENGDNCLDIMICPVDVAPTLKHWQLHIFLELFGRNLIINYRLRTRGSPAGPQAGVVAALPQEKT